MTDTEKRILIIDPSHDERMVMASFIRTEGFEVDTGSSLADALKQLNASHYSCLIMDVDLPEMRGYEAVSILKKINPEIKIIMTTKKNNKELEAKVREQDIFFYFIKSFDKDELKLAIHSAFNN